MRVLAIDDHAELLDLLRRALGRDDHVVFTAASAQEAKRVLERQAVDLILLDLGLPDGSGRELCRELRRRGSDVPILVLTAQSSVSSRVECLDSGADDYLSKPFAVAELRARVRALGRRRRSSRAFVHEQDELFLDFGARYARRGPDEVPITAREWSILEQLAGHAGRVVPRDELLLGIWGEASDATSTSLDVLVGRIRRKLGAQVIRTVRGEGYVLDRSHR